MIDIDRLIQNISVKDCIETYTGRRMRHNKTICPFHDDHEASLSVKTDKGIWKCWACDKGGNIINFTREYFGLGFVDACKKLSDDYGIDDIGLTQSSKPDIWAEIAQEVRRQCIEDKRIAQAEILEEIQLLTTVHGVLFKLGHYEHAARYAQEIDALEAKREYFR